MNDNVSKDYLESRGQEAAYESAARKEERARQKASKREEAQMSNNERKVEVETSQTGGTTGAAGAGGVSNAKMTRKEEMEAKRAARKAEREEKKAARKAKAQAKKEARRARQEEKRAARGRKPKKDKKKKGGAEETLVIPPTGAGPGVPEQPAGKKRTKGKEPADAKSRKRKSTFGGSKYSPVGLDLGRSSLTAVRLQHQAGGSTMMSAALDQLPEGIINEGEVQDVDALGQALKNFWKSHRIRGKKVALGLASQKVVVRTLDFPILDKKELRKAIEFQAQDYIPIPIDEAVFDFHVMGRFTDEEGIEKQKVLVVAAQKAMVMDFIDAVKKARLAIEGIDLQAFALLRSFSQKSFLDEGAPTGQAVAIVNIASDVTNMIIAANGEPQFTRITSFGGDNFTNAVQEQLGVSFAEAEELKARIGLPTGGGEGNNLPPEPEGSGPPQAPGGEPAGGPFAEGLPPQGGDFLEGAGGRMPPGMGGETEGGTARGAGAGETGGEPTVGAPGGGPGGVPPGGPESPGKQGEPSGGAPGGGGWPEGPSTDQDQEKEMIETVQRALEVTVDTFADDLRRSLDYYSSQEDSLPIGQLLLSGGGSMLPNLESHLASLFTFEVKIGDPLGRISRNKSNLTDEELQALSPRLAIAIGLALEDEE